MKFLVKCDFRKIRMLLEERFLPIVLPRLKNSASVCNSDKIKLRVPVDLICQFYLSGQNYITDVIRNLGHKSK